MQYGILELINKFIVSILLRKTTTMLSIIKKLTTAQFDHSHTIKVKNFWTNGKICAKVAFPRYTESVKFRSQIRERASKRKRYRGLGTR